MALLDIFASAVLPVVAVAAVGFVLGRVAEVDTGGLNTVAVYVLTPALVFDSVATTSLPAGALATIAVGVVAFTLAMTALAEGVGRLLGDREPLLSAFVLACVFSNSGNYGIPLSEFAFGTAGRSTAAVFLTVQSVLMYTLGIYVAARSSGRAGLSGVRRVLAVPLVYAVVAALLARRFDLVPPAESTAMETVGMVGDAAIPVVLLILGIELADTDYGAALGNVARPVAVKTALAPLVGAGVALALAAGPPLPGFGEPAVARTFVLETATPTAVTPLILLVEFGDETTIGGVSAAEYVGTAVLVSTLVSVPVLTVLISLLRDGLVL